ncbi:MAG: hypothetical protein A2X02_04975 [Bacteroidetes bacterium GWF2_29_10]|nr:MAG: hypothetical protein A2X02_04975 [Bacteroidetes bacterium GWF2_29_10]
MILIYTHKITNRLKYIFKIIFNALIDSEIKFTTNKDEFNSYNGVKFSYTNRPIADELFFACSSILFETGLEIKDIECFTFEDMPAFFKVSNSSVLRFDPFAASFYLVSRYEEYLPFIKDTHDRFEAKDSLAYKNNFLDKPVVNIWAEKIRSIINIRFGDVIESKKKFNYIPTIDIDNAFAYKNKGYIRTIGAILRALFKNDFADISKRLKVILNLEKDPYDTYNLQIELHKKYKLKPIYFILFGEYGTNDKNISPQNIEYRKLIKSLSDYTDIGIHPSYNSCKNIKTLKAEIDKLSELLNRDITKSRQHFLKMMFPETYRRLIELDIKHDYTMGYASEFGFRASICSEFNFYDIDFEYETPLIIHPFAFMDSTLKNYKKININNVIDILGPLISEVKKVNGTLISIWHNESLGKKDNWDGWDNVYEEILRIATE